VFGGGAGTGSVQYLNMGRLPELVVCGAGVAFVQLEHDAAEGVLSGASVGG